jgi:hypothetical protein
VRSERLDEVTPPFGQALLEDEQRESVTGGVFLRDAVPAEVLDDDPSDAVDGLEANVHLGLLAGGERRRPPGEHEPHGRLPRSDPSDLIDRAVGVRLEEAAVDSRLDAEPPGAAASRLEQSVGSPPLADLGGERFEHPRRRGRDPKCHQDA